MKRIRLIEERSLQPGLPPEQAEADRVDYIACIRQVVRAPLNPMAGVGLEEMEKGLRVLKALDGKKLWDVLELEDADWQHLCEKVRAARWSVVDERLVRFSHTILNATEELLDEPSAPTPAPGSPGGAPAVHPNGRSPGPANGDLAAGARAVPAPRRVDRKPGQVRPGR